MNWQKLMSLTLINHVHDVHGVLLKIVGACYAGNLFKLSFPGYCSRQTIELISRTGPQCYAGNLLEDG